MSRKSKIDPVEKVKIVERYLTGKIGIMQAGKIANIAYQSVQRWVRIYKAEGPIGLLNQTKNRSYSKTLKINAVNDYLSGRGSLGDICQKYDIRSSKQLTDWIKVINVKIIMNTFAHIKMYIFNLQQASYGLLIYKTFLKLKLHGNDEGFYPKLHLQQLHHKKYHPMN